MKNLLAIFLIDRLETERRLLSHKIDFFYIHERLQQVVKSLYSTKKFKINEVNSFRSNSSFRDSELNLKKLLQHFLTCRNMRLGK